MDKKTELDTLYSKALDAHESGSIEKALRLYRQGAAKGDDAAQNAIGNAYNSGDGVKQDKRKAIYWYKKAWKSNKRQPYYCVNIALTYVDLNERRRAMYWWQKSVDFGDGSGALSFAEFLFKTSRNKPYNKTMALLRIAGNSQESWQISPYDKEKAERLLKKLTEQHG